MNSIEIKEVEYAVFTLADGNNPDAVFFVGTTSQVPTKRLSDLLAAARGGRGSSPLHTKIKEILDAEGAVVIETVEVFTDEMEARLASAELAAQLGKSGYTILNKITTPGKAIKSGRPVGSRNGHKQGRLF